jgi:hypothetical protein
MSFSSLTDTSAVMGHGLSATYLSLKISPLHLDLIVPLRTFQAGIFDRKGLEGIFVDF